MEEELARLNAQVESLRAMLAELQDLVEQIDARVDYIEGHLIL